MGKIIFGAVILILLYEFYPQMVKFVKQCFPSLFVKKSWKFNIWYYIDFRKLIFTIIGIVLIWRVFKTVKIPDISWFPTKPFLMKIMECVIYFTLLNFLFNYESGLFSVFRHPFITKVKRLVNWFIFLYLIIGTYPYADIVTKRVKMSFTKSQPKTQQKIDTQKLYETEFPILKKIDETLK
ncbi:MAG: hypothetical protein AB1349_03010 [Elusimicrobiota bacterium]